MLLFFYGTFLTAPCPAAAEELKLPSASASDSQNICFIPNGDARGYIEKRPEYAAAGSASLPGPFTDAEGRLLGRHKGIIGYTAGQRRNLGTAADSRLYVLAVEPGTRRTVLGKENLE